MMNSRFRRSAAQGGPAEIVGGRGKPWKRQAALGWTRHEERTDVVVEAPVSHTSHRQQMDTRGNDRCRLL